MLPPTLRSHPPQTSSASGSPSLTLTLTQWLVYLCRVRAEAHGVEERAGVFLDICRLVRPEEKLCELPACSELIKNRIWFIFWKSIFGSVTWIAASTRWRRSITGMREHNRSNISCHAENLQTILGFYFPFTFLVSLHHTVIFKCYTLKSSVTQKGFCLTFGALLALSCGFKSVSSVWSLCWLWLKLSHWWFTSPWDSTLRFHPEILRSEH